MVILAGIYMEFFTDFDENRVDGLDRNIGQLGCICCNKTYGKKANYLSEFSFCDF